MKSAIPKPSDRIHNLPLNHATRSELYSFFKPLHQDLYRPLVSDVLKSVY